MLAGLAWAAQPALLHAATDERKVDLQLAVSLGGFDLGVLRLNVAIGDRRVRSRLDMESSGPLAWFSGYRGWAEARSVIEDGAPPRPLRYDTYQETKRYNRKTQIRYDRDGQIDELRSWKRGQPQDSRVPEELWAETIDPLTALLHLQHWLTATHNGGAKQLTLNVFDGRRRYVLETALLARTSLALVGEATAASRLRIRMIPLAGFNEDDQFTRWASDGEDRWIEALMLDADDPVPVSMRTHGGTLESAVRLEKLCTPDGGCMTIG